MLGQDGKHFGLSGGLNFPDHADGSGLGGDAEHDGATTGATFAMLALFTEPVGMHCFVLGIGWRWL